MRADREFDTLCIVWAQDAGRTIYEPGEQGGRPKFDITQLLPGALVLRQNGDVPPFNIDERTR